MILSNILLEHARKILREKKLRAKRAVTEAVAVKKQRADEESRKNWEEMIHYMDKKETRRYKHKNMHTKEEKKTLLYVALVYSQWLHLK